MEKVIVIAEAGVNHNGDIELAKRLIDVAADAGVDYVKFQTFKAENLVSIDAKKATYQIQNTNIKDETQFEMLKKLELSHSDHEEIIAYCKFKNINFFSTAFDLDSLEYLAQIGLKIVKVPSGEITNLPYLKLASKLFNEVILSTGMATMSEIEDAFNVFREAGIPKSKITILHCNTEYPTPMKDVNLKAMLNIGDKFNCEIGYSDHTLGIEVPIAAVALGAKIIEKHFTLDRNLPGPDHLASLEPNQLKDMVVSIRNIELALSGSGIKEPSISEMNNISIVRKSLYFKSSLKKGHIIENDDLKAMRPGLGISPMKLDSYLGKKLIQDVEEGSLLLDNIVI